MEFLQFNHLLLVSFIEVKATLTLLTERKHPLAPPGTWVVTELTEADASHSFGTNKSHISLRKGSKILCWAQRDLSSTKKENIKQEEGVSPATNPLLIKRAAGSQNIPKIKDSWHTFLPLGRDATDHRCCVEALCLGQAPRMGRHRDTLET